MRTGVILLLLVQLLLRGAAGPHLHALDAAAERSHLGARPHVHVNAQPHSHWCSVPLQDSVIMIDGSAGSTDAVLEPTAPDHDDDAVYFADEWPARLLPRPAVTGGRSVNDISTLSGLNHIGWMSSHGAVLAGVRIFDADHPAAQIAAQRLGRLQV